MKRLVLALVLSFGFVAGCTEYRPTPSVEPKQGKTDMSNSPSQSPAGTNAPPGASDWAPTGGGTSGSTSGGGNR